MAGRPPSFASCIAELSCEVQALAAKRARDDLQLIRVARELATLAEQHRVERAS